MNRLRKLFGKDVLRDFWHWFAKHQEAFYHFEDNQQQLFGALQKKLFEIHHDLSFEFGPVQQNGRRIFTITAGGIRDAFPFVVQLVDRAPKLEKWQVNAFKQRVPANDLSVQLGEEVKLGYSDIFFEYVFKDELVNLNLYIKNYKDNDQYKGAAFILLDALLGEYDTETYLGSVEFSRLAEPPGEGLLPFVKLRSIIDSRR